MQWTQWRKLMWAIVWEFRLVLLLLLAVMLGGGALLHLGKGLAFTDAMLAAFAASFFEIIVDPPYPYYIQAFLYTAPLIGLYVLADSIATLIALLSGKRQKLQKWWEMLASTYQDHIVVCGVGKVGYRVINELRNAGQAVVGIEDNFQRPYVQELLEESIPIIQGNIRIRAVLERAGVARARAVICVTSDDLANLDCAFTARELKPDLRVVIRVFDDTIAQKMSEQFDLPAISTSYASAPAFVSQALGLEISQTQLTVYGHSAHVYPIEVNKEHNGKTVAAFESLQQCKLIGYKTKEGKEIFPAPDHAMQSGDQVIAVKMER